MVRKEYIDRNEALNAFPEYGSGFARFRIRNIPSADVVPWSWLEQYATDKRYNYASEFVEEARKEWENGTADIL